MLASLSAKWYIKNCLIFTGLLNLFYSPQFYTLMCTTSSRLTKDTVWKDNKHQLHLDAFFCCSWTCHFTCNSWCFVWLVGFEILFCLLVFNIYKLIYKLAQISDVSLHQCIYLINQSIRLLLLDFLLSLKTFCYHLNYVRMLSSGHSLSHNIPRKW